MGYSEFLWSFPCYILVARPAAAPDPGDAGVRLDFVAPKVGPGREQCIAVFTDLDLAREYRRQCDRPDRLRPLGFETPSQLRAFLECAQEGYRYLFLDPNPAALRHWLTPIRELIPLLVPDEE